jgi:gas vesicle protein
MEVCSDVRLAGSWRQLLFDKSITKRKYKTSYKTTAAPPSQKTIQTACKDTAKMADDVSLQIEDALNSIINTTDKSGHLKRELREEIHTTVSSLRKLVHSLRNELQDTKQEHQNMCMEVKQLKDTLDKERATTSARQVATSVNDTPTLANSRTSHATSIGGKKK